MHFEIDQDYVLKTLVDLVRINSVNPSIASEGKGEREISTYVADSLSSIGLSVKIHEIKPERSNVVGVLKGSGEGPTLLLNAHMDTVGVEGMIHDPFGAEIRDGCLFGRGAQDMKGSLAAMMGAAKALVDSGVELAGDLLITGVADEEHASMGMDELVKHVTADAAIVTEPTDLALCRAHRGFIWYDVETYGKAAHGSRYQDGIDANMRMGRFLAKLEDLEQELLTRPPHPLVGPPSLHAARLAGGSAVSVYAAYCLLQIERRTKPGELEPQATQELQAIIDQLEVEDPTFKATVKSAFARDPFEISADAKIIKVLEAVITKLTGKRPAHSGQSFWTDAAILASAGIETVLIGPTGGGLHSEEEWVDIQSVMDLTKILAETSISYCQP